LWGGGDDRTNEPLMELSESGGLVGFVHMHHPLAACGLFLSLLGSLLLLSFPPVVTIYTAKGEPLVQWVSREIPGGRRRYLFQKFGFCVAILMLAGGFLLQLLDLFCS
jgi:hypothetical protein